MSVLNLHRLMLRTAGRMDRKQWAKLSGGRGQVLDREGDVELYTICGASNQLAVRNTATHMGVAINHRRIRAASAKAKSLVFLARQLHMDLPAAPTATQVVEEANEVVAAYRIGEEIKTLSPSQSVSRDPRGQRLMAFLTLLLAVTLISLR